MQTTVVSSRSTRARAQATARTVRGSCIVLDLDGSYEAVGTEHVLTPEQIGMDTRELSTRRVIADAADLERWARPLLVRHLLRQAKTLLSVVPGVLFLDGPTDAWGAVPADGVGLIVRAGAADDGLWPALRDLETYGSYSPAVVAVGPEGAAFVEAWADLAPEHGDRWLDVLASRHPHGRLDDALLVSTWSAAVDLPVAVAADLSTVELSEPWVLDPRASTTPRVRLSAHPELAAHVTSFVAEVSADVAPGATTSLGLPVEPHVGALVRAAVEAGTPLGDVPDLFDPAGTDVLRDWLTTPVRGGVGSPGRYLVEVHAARPDVRAAFPHVDGADREAFLAWADLHGLDGVATAEAPPAAAAPRRVAGVNVVGYLSGELGVGESARLMLSAIEAGGVDHTTVAVTKNLRSRQNASFRSSSSDTLFDTTLLCVNATEVQSVSASIPAVVKGTYRIGMWYWETEDFPRNQRKGFRHVDEVWVATDFVRAAVEPHSPVPVRTIMPPLPQPRDDVDQAAARARLGLPDRPILLFAFDYASIAERKNPWGVVEAFEQAFAPGEGPLLVVKSINADRKPAQAERLRLRVQESPDVLLIEEYLDADDRDALMAACDCYVSLHRSEGLGLTMAEAMACGKPVIATGYGGNLQFMTDDNSFLVPSTPIAIPRGSGPYAPGATWADPDLAVAARLMRSVVVDDPAGAARRGRRAMQDLREKHSPDAAARAVVERLAQIRGSAQEQAAEPRASDVRSTVRRVIRGRRG